MAATSAPLTSSAPGSVDNDSVAVFSVGFTAHAREIANALLEVN
jgi:hypothetical protein